MHVSPCQFERMIHIYCSVPADHGHGWSCMYFAGVTHLWPRFRWRNPPLGPRPGSEHYALDPITTRAKESISPKENQQHELEVVGSGKYVRVSFFFLFCHYMALMRHRELLPTARIETTRTLSSLMIGVSRRQAVQRRTNNSLALM